MTAARIASTLGKRLKEIAGKIGLSLTSSAIFHAMKAHFGL